MAQRGQRSFFLESFSHNLQNFWGIFERQLAYTYFLHRRAGGCLAERFGSQLTVEAASLLGHGLLRWKLLIMRVGWDAKLGGIEINWILDEPLPANVKKTPA